MENMMSTENLVTIILVIAFFTWLLMEDQKGARK